MRISALFFSGVFFWFQAESIRGYRCGVVVPPAFRMDAARPAEAGMRPWGG
jgi:hypothetical protein